MAGRDTRGEKDASTEQRLFLSPPLTTTTPSLFYIPLASHARDRDRTCLGLGVVGAHALTLCRVQADPINLMRASYPAPDVYFQRKVALISGESRPSSRIIPTSRVLTLPFACRAQVSRVRTARTSPSSC